MNEFQVAGQTYKARKMDAKKQFHVARRLTPFMTGLISKLPPDIIGKAIKGDKIDISLIDPLAMLEPIIANLGAMSDEDADYVLDNCLEHCDRKMPNDTGWGPVKVPGANVQYADIDMVAMLQIAWNVIQGNLGRFFPAPSLTSTEQVSAE